MSSIRNSLKGVARWFYSRLLYISLATQIDNAIAFNRMKEAHRLCRYRRRLQNIIFDK